MTQKVDGGTVKSLPLSTSILSEKQTKVKEDFDVNMYEMSAELCKLKTLASCLEDRLVKANITINEDGEAVFSLVDMLQERIGALIDSVCSQEGAAA